MPTKKELANRLSLVKDDRDALYENYNEVLSRLEKAEQELFDLREKINDALGEIETETIEWHDRANEPLGPYTQGTYDQAKDTIEIIRKHTGGENAGENKPKQE